MFAKRRALENPVVYWTVLLRAIRIRVLLPRAFTDLKPEVDSTTHVSLLIKEPYLLIN